MAIAVGDKSMMPVLRFGQAEQGLQKSLRMGSGKKVLAPGDQCDSLSRVVYDDAQMVTGRCFLPGYDKIAFLSQIDGRESCHTVGELKISHQGEGSFVVDS